jgi:hypothetical protein
MVENGHKQALADAIVEARAEELKREQGENAQFDLFEAFGGVQSTQVAVVNGGSRGPGRPVGARNKRTDEAARFYMSRFGDPLARGVEIAAIPILAQGGRVLVELAKVLGMSRPDAAKWWASIYAATLPYTHQRLATLTVKPEGSPDGEPIPLPWSYAEDEVLGHLELTHTNPPDREKSLENSRFWCSTCCSTGTWYYSRNDRNTVTPPNPRDRDWRRATGTGEIAARLRRVLHCSDFTATVDGDDLVTGPIDALGAQCNRRDASDWDWPVIYWDGFKGVVAGPG